MHSVRVLVADDDPTIRNLLEAVCTLAGYEVCTARNGAEALDMLLEADEPWVVLLDVEMPILTGPEVCAQLAAVGGTAGRHLVLLITAGDFPENDPPSPAWAVLRKPFDIATLLDIVARLATGTRHDSDTGDATSDLLYASWSDHSGSAA
jgi:two-component system, chemotaxis family, chemotaxis protein CheY